MPAQRILLMLASMLLLATPAFADNGPQIAQVKTATGAAFVVRDGKSTQVKPGDALYEHDTLQTAAGASMGVTFSDNTVMSLGPESQCELAQYAFDSSNFKGSMLTDMQRGTFTMVSGDIARSSPNAMKVKTPTAMLGVRGTSFAIQVGN